MERIQIARNGLILRAVSCPKCGSKIIHPKDEQEYNDFVDLKKKEFTVKMRYVGNSYAVSIPKELVNFIKVQERIMDDMVRLCLEDFGRISLEFGNHQINHNNNNNNNNNKVNDITKIKEN